MTTQIVLGSGRAALLPVHREQSMMVNSTQSESSEQASADR